MQESEDVCSLGLRNEDLGSFDVGIVEGAPCDSALVCVAGKDNNNRAYLDFQN